MEKHCKCNHEKEPKVTTTYRCAICGEAYSTIAERSACEAKCVKKLEMEEKLEAERKKKAEKDARKKEVDEAIEHATKLIKEYMKDYNEFEFSTVDTSDLSDIIRGLNTPLSLNRFFRMLP